MFRVWAITIVPLLLSLLIQTQLFNCINQDGSIATAILCHQQRACAYFSFFQLVLFL